MLEGLGSDQRALHGFSRGRVGHGPRDAAGIRERDRCDGPVLGAAVEPRTDVPGMGGLKQADARVRGQGDGKSAGLVGDGRAERRVRSRNPFDLLVFDLIRADLDATDRLAAGVHDGSLDLVIQREQHQGDRILVRPLRPQVSIGDTGPAQRPIVGARQELDPAVVRVDGTRNRPSAPVRYRRPSAVER